jgi:hypothetical protein
MSGWWDDLAAIAEAAGCDRHSAAWYRSMRDQYLERFPHADERSKDNMRMFVKHAEAKEDPTRCPGDILCAEGRCEWPNCAAAKEIAR